MEVGVSGQFKCEARICHWRQERRSPRAFAIRALLVIDRVPRGPQFLMVMLAESAHASIVIAQGAVPYRFPIEDWRRAASAAGELAAAEAQVRAVRQRCRELGWSGDRSAFAAELELAGIVRQLSGRLLETDRSGYPVRCLAASVPLDSGRIDRSNQGDVRNVLRSATPLRVWLATLDAPVPSTNGTSLSRILRK